MSEQWELICHHTYSGTPGVAFDLSPTHRSHGVAVGLMSNDYIVDGATAGSGAVRFTSPNARIQIPPSASWSPLGAIHGEVTLLRESTRFGRVIDADSFWLDLRGGLSAWFASFPNQYAQVTLDYDALPGAPAAVPVGRWTTVGFAHDGVATMELFIDGSVVARASQPLYPVSATASVTIGNASAGGYAPDAVIDEVKIWRPNPRRVSDEFLGRPMDAATAECLKQWLSRLDQWKAANPQCVEEVSRIVTTLTGSTLRDICAVGPSSRDRLEETAIRYRELWRTGQIDSSEMARLVTDFEQWLGPQGITDTAQRQLQQSECLKRFIAEVGPPDCDPHLSGLFARLQQEHRQRTDTM